MTEDIRMEYISLDYKLREIGYYAVGPVELEGVLDSLSTFDRKNIEEIRIIKPSDARKGYNEFPPNHYMVYVLLSDDKKRIRNKAREETNPNWGIVSRSLRSWYGEKNV